jgi:hypothetical protein
MGALRGAVVVLLASASAACVAKPEGAPPSARQSVASSVAGLLDLFARECIQQRDLGWTREESKRVRATCDGFLVGDGEEGDCEQSVDGQVSWVVPTQDGSTILVEMSWTPGQTPSKITCSISTRAKDDALGSVAQRIAAAQSLQRQPRTTAGDMVWQGANGSSTPPTLRLHTYSAVELEDPSPRLDTEGQWAARSLALRRQHPRELEYRPAA